MCIHINGSFCCIPETNTTPLNMKKVLVAQSCPTLCDPIDCSPGSSVYGISQTRILEWVAISYSRDLPDPGIEPTSPALESRFFTTVPPGKPFSHLVNQYFLSST